MKVRLLLLLGLLMFGAGEPSWWATPRHGANFFDREETEARLAAAEQAGITWVRLAPNKWHTTARDFLIGDADHYTALVAPDVAAVRAFLDQAEKHHIKVVLTMLSLPGARWRQQNDDRFDGRLWQSDAYQEQAAAFWRDLALKLKGHPALAAYNVINEPNPEKMTGFHDFRKQNFDTWYATVRGTPADLNRFYERVLAAIRSADATTPIMLDAGMEATPYAFRYLRPLSDTNTLYAFHMYEPYELTHKPTNAGRFHFPGPVTFDNGDSAQVDAEYLRAFLEPVQAWEDLWHVSPDHVVAAEFGCHRTIPGAASYLGDLLRDFDAAGWHWAFYSYREDTWSGMDYERGPEEGAA